MISGEGGLACSINSGYQRKSASFTLQKDPVQAGAIVFSALKSAFTSQFLSFVTSLPILCFGAQVWKSCSSSWFGFLIACVSRFNTSKETLLVKDLLANSEITLPWQQTIQESKREYNWGSLLFSVSSPLFLENRLIQNSKGPDTKKNKFNNNIYIRSFPLD